MGAARRKKLAGYVPSSKGSNESASPVRLLPRRYSKGLMTLVSAWATALESVSRHDKGWGPPINKERFK